MRGLDPREMADSDLIVVWGGNPGGTQVNVMTWVAKARKARGAKLVVVDPYAPPPPSQADLHLALRPGTDGALACAVMHVAVRRRATPTAPTWPATPAMPTAGGPLASRTPEWAAAITGLSAEEIAISPASTGGQAQLPPPRLRLHPLAQRRFEHARRILPAGGHRRLAASGRRRPVRQQRPLSPRRDADQGLDRATGTCARWTSRGSARCSPAIRRDLGDGPPVTAMLIQNTNPWWSRRSRPGCATGCCARTCSSACTSSS
jgi:hypothetical protein